MAGTVGHGVRRRKRRVRPSTIERRFAKVSGTAKRGRAQREISCAAKRTQRAAVERCYEKRGIRQSIAGREGKCRMRQGKSSAAANETRGGEMQGRIRTAGVRQGAAAKLKMPSPKGCGLPCRKAVGADRPPAVPPPQSAAGEPPERTKEWAP